MIASVFPFRTVLVQILVLFLAIAISSWFLQKLLKLGPKISLEYAAILNLSCTCMGWLVFFGIESVLSKDLRQRLIDYILLAGDQDFYLIITNIVIFVLTVTLSPNRKHYNCYKTRYTGIKKLLYPLNSNAHSPSPAVLRKEVLKSPPNLEQFSSLTLLVIA